MLNCLGVDVKAPKLALGTMIVDHYRLYNQVTGPTVSCQRHQLNSCLPVGDAQLRPDHPATQQFSIRDFVGASRLADAILLHSLFPTRAPKARCEFRIIDQCEDGLGNFLRIAWLDSEPAPRNLLRHAANGRRHDRFLAQHGFQETERKSLGYTRKDHDIAFVKGGGGV